MSTSYKRTYRPRRYVKKYYARPAPSRWSVYGGAGKQLVKDVMYLKTLINSEPHNHYVSSANNFSYNGIIVSLSDVVQGDTSNHRSGNRVLPRWANVRWWVNAGTAGQFVRVILFRYWGESTSAAPSVTVAEVLKTVGNQFAPLSHLNDDNTGPKGDRARRIEVLRSELFTIDSVERNTMCGSWDVEMNGMGVSKKEHMEWRSSTTEDPTSGGVYALFITNTATNASYALESKLTFYDN